MSSLRQSSVFSPAQDASASIGQLELGGREHPKYQNLTMAQKSLVGLAKLIMRMVLLKPTDNADESEKALVGNTILVAQPSPEMIVAELPPTEAEQASYFNVVYGAGASEHASSKLGKKKH